MLELDKNIFCTATLVKVSIAQMAQKVLSDRLSCPCICIGPDEQILTD